MKKANKLSASRNLDSLQRRKAKKFYTKKQPGQKIGWRTFRERYKEEMREAHEKIVLDVYKENPDNAPDDLMAFIKSDYPLCEHNLKKGKIKVAQVLDHIVPIRQGGAKFAKGNLQWLTEHYHSRKSGQESYQTRK